MFAVSRDQFASSCFPDLNSTVFSSARYAAAIRRPGDGSDGLGVSLVGQDMLASQNCGDMDSRAPAGGNVLLVRRPVQREFLGG